MNESENPQLGRTVESLVAEMKSRGITYRRDYIYVAWMSTFLGEKNLSRWLTSIENSDTF